MGAYQPVPLEGAGSSPVGSIPILVNGRDGMEGSLGQEAPFSNIDPPIAQVHNLGVTGTG